MVYGANSVEEMLTVTIPEDTGLTKIFSPKSIDVTNPT